MSAEKDIDEFVLSIRKELPLESDLTDQKMLERGFDLEDELHHLWVEQLADVTNEFLRQKNFEEATKQLNFFASSYNSGNYHVKNCIDVSYAENLMWNLEPKDKKQAWLVIPRELKALYIAIWGEPSF